MKKVLVVAHYFPPCGGVSSFRVTKFVKYLGDFGWEPIVITVKPEYYEVTDEHLFEDNIPDDVEVYRTDLFLSSVIKNRGVNWIIPLRKEIKKVLKKHKIDVIFMTGDPFFQFFVGKWAERKYGIPYVLDFRDEWFLSQYREDRSLKSRIKTKIVGIAERSVLRKASKVIVVNTMMEELYSNYYIEDKQVRDKFVTITNGYDVEDYTHIKPVKYDKFTIVYTGKYANFRDPGFFLSILKKLLQDGFNMQFVHVGSRETVLVDKVKELGIEDNVIYTGFKSYRESLSFAKGADVLLLIGGKSKVEQTAKIFDYLGCNKPILALAQRDGGVADIINTLNYGNLFENSSQSFDQVYGLLKSMINEKIELEQTGLEVMKKHLSSYDRLELTKKLAEVLDEVSNGKR